MLYLFRDDIFDKDGKIKYGGVKRDNGNASIHANSSYILKDTIVAILVVKRRIFIDDLRLELAQCGISIGHEDLCDFCGELSEGNFFGDDELEVNDTYVCIHDSRDAMQAKCMLLFSSIWKKARKPQNEFLRERILMCINKG